MGALLVNAIKKLKDDDIFCVGSRSSFFFIGTKADWERDKEDVEKWCYEFTKAEAIKAREVWETKLYLGLPKRENFAGHEQWTIESMNAVRFLNQAQQRMLAAERAVKNYKPVITRYVNNEYDRTIATEPQNGGHAFIISGVEVGKYWFCHEYISKIEPEKDDEEETEE